MTPRAATTMSNSSVIVSTWTTSNLLKFSWVMWGIRSCWCSVIPSMRSISGRATARFCNMRWSSCFSLQLIVFYLYVYNLFFSMFFYFSEYFLRAVMFLISNITIVNLCISLSSVSSIVFRVSFIVPCLCLFSLLLSFHCTYPLYPAIHILCVLHLVFFRRLWFLRLLGILFNLNFLIVIISLAFHGF